LLLQSTFAMRSRVVLAIRGITLGGLFADDSYCTAWMGTRYGAPLSETRIFRASGAARSTGWPA
jgi:hypothetical protein